VDTLILGCTHYPLLKGVLGRVVGPKVNLVDSATEVAGAVKDILVRKGLLRMALKPARHTYLVSDEPELFKRLAVRFLGNSVKNVQRYRDV
jgi:glutamate racemase